MAIIVYLLFLISVSSHHFSYIFAIGRTFIPALRLDTLHGVLITSGHILIATILLHPRHVLHKALRVALEQHLTHKIVERHRIFRIVDEEQPQHLIDFVVAVKEIVFETDLSKFSIDWMLIHLTVTIEQLFDLLRP